MMAAVSESFMVVYISSFFNLCRKCGKDMDAGFVRCKKL